MMAASAAALCLNLWQHVSKRAGSLCAIYHSSFKGVKVALQAVKDEVDLELQGR